MRLFWVDVAYENVKSDHPKLTKRRLIAQILHQYQDRGDAKRYLDVEGKIAWKASPRFLTKLADAERDAQVGRVSVVARATVAHACQAPGAIRNLHLFDSRV
jgi:hypothetical protein